MKFFKFWDTIRERREANLEMGKLGAYPHLLAIKPREKYVFRSDYYQTDTSVACMAGSFSTTDFIL